MQNDFNVQVTPLWQGIEEIESLMQRFNAVCDGFSGKRPKVMLLHHTYVGSDADDVDLAARELSRFYCYFCAWFQNKRTVSQGHIDPLTDDELATNTMWPRKT